MQGSKYFDYFLIALVVIVIALIAIAIVVSIIGGRKRKNVSLKSAKSEKIREKRARGVFNYDSEGRFIGDEEDEDDGSSNDSQDDSRMRRQRRRADNSAVISMVRRSHSDHDDRSTPQVSLKPVPAQAPESDQTADDDALPLDGEYGADGNAGTYPMDNQPVGDDYGSYADQETAESYSGNTGYGAGQQVRMPHIPQQAQNPPVSMPRVQSTPAVSADDGEPVQGDAGMQAPTEPETRNRSNSSGPRHARHARNPFSRPVSADDMEGGAR